MTFVHEQQAQKAQSVQSRQVDRPTVSDEQASLLGAPLYLPRYFGNLVTQQLPTIQRKCGCGASLTPAGECANCNRKRVALQQQEGQEEEQQITEEPATLQRHQADAGGLSHDNVNATETRSGMPNDLRAGLEQIAGIDLSAVRVHYNSPRPARLDALAYTQGTDIHVGPGQEKYLSHEGWHVVQQLQGRVQPTIQAKRMSINDDKGLEREADVMGAKARQLAGKARVADFHTRFATPDSPSPEDEPYVTPIGEVSQAATRRSTTPAINPGGTSVIQRATNFAAGTVTATTNMAAHLIAGNRDAGFTPPTLNGTTILSAAAARGAIRAPTLGGRSNVDGTVDTWVSSVATNEASFTMRVPSGGPWSTVTAKANVAALFASLGLTAQAGCSTAGDSTFSVKGQPSDADFAANVRTHEDLHAADHRRGFDAIIVPWDASLEAAKTAGTEFSGATAADAEAALFAAMGGTPATIATNQHNRWIALNNATHAAGVSVATGGPATPSNSAANATCTTSSIDAT